MQRLFNAGFAPSNLDIGTILYNARKDLKAVWEPGDSIFLFGFSRGAAIARKFASQLDRALLEKTPENGKEPGQRPIRFVGVFDTVASIWNA